MHVLFGTDRYSQEVWKEGFDYWMRQVDKELVAVCGLSSECLADCCYATWYDDGFSPEEAAWAALEANDFPFGDDDFSFE